MVCVVENPSIAVDPLLAKYTSPPKADTLGVDKVFMINLLRRPERRTRMHHCFTELGINATTVNAVDGRYALFLVSAEKII